MWFLWILRIFVKLSLHWFLDSFWKIICVNCFWSLHCTVDSTWKLRLSHHVWRVETWKAMPKPDMQKWMFLPWRRTYGWRRMRARKWVRLRRHVRHQKIGMCITSKRMFVLDGAKHRNVSCLKKTYRRH